MAGGHRNASPRPFAATHCCDVHAETRDRRGSEAASKHASSDVQEYACYLVIPVEHWQPLREVFPGEELWPLYGAPLAMANAASGKTAAGRSVAT
eukprot:CAMPEP_0119320036 /NCGR_PEP_ID=MMETSP1333-20130426/51207_1 /TAXON_ID=418940 /ORGANISM="Scyphosphaera apsteinii, Strain RCC1455" /LENGTH=94 /DNA_ID=CAMNT_0007326631 /DNA_START=134 /DNA_END=419 /DNA_ORIENTATION=+